MYTKNNPLNKILTELSINNCVDICLKTDFMDVEEFKEYIKDMTIIDLNKLGCDMAMAYQLGELNINIEGKVYNKHELKNKLILHDFENGDIADFDK